MTFSSYPHLVVVEIARNMIQKRKKRQYRKPCPIYAQSSISALSHLRQSQKFEPWTVS